MQDTELLLSLAEIAGVFVGFAALISVRSGGASDPHEVVYMRAVVWMGLMTIVAALTPVTLGRYALAEHQVWALSSVLVLVAWGVMFVSMAGTPEYKTAWTAELEADRVARSRWLFPQEEEQISVTDAALVIGGGVAGMQAALDLADAGHQVYLVEKKPSIGGIMAQLDKVYPDIECSI